jgi:hypothetical protein
MNLIVERASFFFAKFKKCLSIQQTTVCDEDCGLNSQKYWYNIIFACSIGKFDSSHVEI